MSSEPGRKRPVAGRNPTALATAAVRPSGGTPSEFDRRFRRDTGIALRVTPFSRTSHVVTWLSTRSGRVTTVIKGALRPKSAFLGQYDLFYRCELVYYSRDRNGAHILKECAPLDTRSGLRSDWRRIICASYFCDLVAKLVPPESPAEELFALLDRSLSHLESGGAHRAMVSWFELQAAKAAGFAPMLDRCAGCSGDLGNAPRKNACFSAPRGGLLCDSCAAGAAGGVMTVGRGSLETMRFWQGAPDPGRLIARDCPDSSLLEIEKAAARFLEYHLHDVSAGRAVAAELVSAGVARRS